MYEGKTAIVKMDAFRFQICDRAKRLAKATNVRTRDIFCPQTDTAGGLSLHMGSKAAFSINLAEWNGLFLGVRRRIFEGARRATLLGDVLATIDTPKAICLSLWAK